MAKTIRSSGLGMTIELTDNSPEVLEALKNAIERGLEAVGTNAQEHATKIITAAKAVDTGRLRNSITYALAGKGAHNATYQDDNKKQYSYSGTAPAGGNVVYIGTNVEYAMGIETGSHRKKGAVHFLQKSVDDYKDEYRKLMKDSLENA